MRISKEMFLKLVKDYIERNEKMDKIADVLEDVGFGFDFLYENPAAVYGENLFDWILQNTFEQDAYDLVWWYVLDKQTNKELYYKVDGKEIPTETPEDIWEEVKDKMK